MCVRGLFLGWGSSFSSRYWLIQPTFVRGQLKCGTLCWRVELDWAHFYRNVAYFNINRAYFYVNVPRGSTGLFTDCLRLEHIVRPIHGFEQLCCEVFRFVCLKRSYFLQVFLCSVRKEQQQIAKAEFYNILLSLLMKSDYNISC